MISNIFNKDAVKILSYLLISPGSKYTRNEIKEKTKMNNIPLDKTLTKLIILKILKKEKNLLMLNLGQEEAKEIIIKIKEDFKKLNLPHNIFSTTLDISDKLAELKYIRKAILFGSYAKLIYSDNSDIDIAIILDVKVKNLNKLKKIIEKDINKISKKNKKEIELHFFNESDLKHKEDALIKDILRNGKDIL